MKASETDILMVPGYGNSGPDHWQSRWQSKLASARRVEQGSWDQPSREEWISSIVESVQAATKPVVLDGMGIVGDRIHSSDEWADLDSVAPRLYLTLRMLEMMGK